MIEGAGLYYLLRLLSLPLTLKEDVIPFKSQAQRAKFAQLVKEGKMSQATFDKWEAETKESALPKKAIYKPKGQVRGVRKVR